MTDIKKGVALATPFCPCGQCCDDLPNRHQDNLCQLNCVLSLTVSSTGWLLLLPVMRTVPCRVPLMTVPISPLPET